MAFDGSRAARYELMRARAMTRPSTRYGIVPSSAPVRSATLSRLRARLDVFPAASG